MFKALIFDFDGLILDTETPEYQSLNEAYNRMGQSLAIQTYGLVVGSQYGQDYEPLADLRARTDNDVDAEAFWQAVNLRRMELIEQSPILPGVEALLRQARGMGLGLAVASSSRHKWVDGHLKRLGLWGYFNTVICRDDVREIKPAPDLFLAALKALRVQPAEAVVFEDSAHGIQAANRAGVPCVLVPNPVTRHLDIHGESLRLDSLAELPLPVLLERLSDKSG